MASTRGKVATRRMGFPSGPKPGKSSTTGSLRKPAARTVKVAAAVGKGLPYKRGLVDDPSTGY
jgi:hypothetical protein